MTPLTDAMGLINNDPVYQIVFIETNKKLSNFGRSFDFLRSQKNQFWRLTIAPLDLVINLIKSQLIFMIASQC